MSDPNTEAREVGKWLGAMDAPLGVIAAQERVAAALEQAGRTLERLAPFAAAMDEDSGALIVALHDRALDRDELAKIIEAAQAVDAEGQDALEARMLPDG